jgi:arylsulfatase A-like enzyme
MLLPRCQGYLPLEEYTLGEALRDAGYRTGFVGKWHLGHDAKYWPEHQGFDVNIGGGRWPGPPSYFSPYRIDNLPDGPEGEYIADRLTDEAVKFIEESKDGPFFLNFWQYAVHAPYQGKEEYRAHFEAKQDPRGAQDNAVMGAMIESMDDSLGRVLDTLERLGLMDDTIVVFSSDNGGNMYDRTARDGVNFGAWAPEGRTPTNNAPLCGGKGSVYEGGIRVPSIVYWPGKTEGGTVSREAISSVDYYPSLLDMLDIAPAPGQVFDGVSIMPALLGKRLKREAIYGHFPHYVPAVPCRPASWVRKDEWKLIRFYEQDENFPNRIELYNLDEDIAEMNNQAERYPKRARELEAMLDRHLAETGALVPMPNPAYQPEALREVAGWTPSGQCWLECGQRFLAVNSIGQDPFIVTNTVPEISGNLTARFRMKSASDGVGQFFWTTRTVPNFGPKQRLDFAPIHDGQWYEYEIGFAPASPLTGLRLDPSAAPGTIQIEWLRISQEGAVVKEWSFQ